MNTLQRLLLILLLLSLSGCYGASLVTAQDTCADLNWYELGRSDGIRGQPSLNWQKRVDHCRGFGDPEHRLYTNGWYSGVDEFCSNSHGYHFGKTGQTYYEVCPKSKEEEFLQTYQTGLQAYLFERSLDRLAIKVKGLEDEIQNSQEEASRSVLQEQLKNLQKKQIRHRSSLLKIETEMKSLAL